MPTGRHMVHDIRARLPTYLVAVAGQQVLDGHDRESTTATTAAPPAAGVAAKVIRNHLEHFTKLALLQTKWGTGRFSLWTGSWTTPTTLG